MKETIKSGFLLLAILAGSVAIHVPYRYLHEQSLIDHCLFGKHGSFNYSKMVCDFHETHEYVPYRVRHPHDKTTTLIAVVSFVVFSAGFGFMQFSSNNR
jgi:hypothetical protein